MNKRFNFKKSKILSLLVMSVFCLTSITAFVENSCVGITDCYDNLLDKDVAFDLNINQFMSIQYPFGTITDEQFNQNGWGGGTTFTISYDITTGLLSYEINGGLVISETIPTNQVFDTLSIVNIIPEARSTSVSLTGMTLNDLAIRDIETASMTEGIHFLDFDSERNGFVLTGQILLTDSGGATPTHPIFNVILSGMTEAPPLPEVVIIGGETSVFLEEIIDVSLSDLLGGLSVNVQETETRYIEGFGQTIWTHTNIFDVMNFEVVIFEANGNPNLGSLVYGSVFETTEEILVNGVLGIWETTNINDDVINYGYSVIAQEGETLAILPTSNYDLWILI